MLFYPTPNQAAKQKMSLGDNELPAGFRLPDLPPFIRTDVFRFVLPRAGVVVRYNFRSKIYFPARLERNKVQYQ